MVCCQYCFALNIIYGKEVCFVNKVNVVVIIKSVISTYTNVLAERIVVFLRFTFVEVGINQIFPVSINI